MRIAGIFLIIWAALSIFGCASAQKIYSTPAIVIGNGAALYKTPDFDSSVNEYLECGEKVLIAEKKIPGRTDGAFYKIKSRNGILGYITDRDVKIGQIRDAECHDTGETIID